jgi:hypothetical protein
MTEIYDTGVFLLFFGLAFYVIYSLISHYSSRARDINPKGTFMGTYIEKNRTLIIISVIVTGASWWYMSNRNKQLAL